MFHSFINKTKRGLTDLYIKYTKPPFLYFLEPEHKRVAFVVPAKVGGTSIRRWLWIVTYGEEYRGSSLHECIPFCYSRKLPSSVLRVVAVHRNGVERMRSTYDHRVKKEREAEDKGILFFASNLSEYSKTHPSVAHHAKAQYYWLGDNPSLYTDIIPLQNINLLPEILSDVMGKNLPEVPRMHVTKEKTEIDDKTALLFEKWTEEDVRIGWNGTLVKGRIIGMR